MSNLPEPGTMIKCINPNNLPEGAGPLVKGQEYEVIWATVNSYGQRIVFLVGLPQYGTTPRGLQWNGYDLKRFGTTIDDILEVEEEVEEVVPMLN